MPIPWQTALNIPIVFYSFFKLMANRYVDSLA
jgi:hypothetical protein